jgi:hypothetical protein
MMDAPIVEEIRRIRDEHAAKFGYDIEAIVRDLQEQERASGDELFEFSPKACAPLPHIGETPQVDSNVGTVN